MVDKGYSQVKGIDYNETFAPVEKMDSIRLAQAIANSKQWEVHHMDVKCAFLNGYLNEDIYMQKPKFFCVSSIFSVQDKEIIVWAKTSPYCLVCQD